MNIDKIKFFRKFGRYENFMKTKSRQNGSDTNGKQTERMKLIEES